MSGNGRRDFHGLFESMQGTSKKISVTPLNFRRLSPYTFTVEVDMDGVAVLIVLRDPEHARIDAHGLECCMAPDGRSVSVLRVGQPAWLQLHPAAGDISLQAGCLFTKTSQWITEI